MRPVYFYGAMSLDGYLSDEQDNLQWLFDTNLDGQSTYEAFEQKIDTLYASDGPGDLRNHASVVG